MSPLKIADEENEKRRRRFLEFMESPKSEYNLAASAFSSTCDLLSE